MNHMDECCFTETGKIKNWEYKGKSMNIYNQRSRLWMHAYDFRKPPQSTLYDSGCGIFSIAHAVGWMNGIAVNAEELGIFSCEHNGRGDDGTDRPKLLSEMMTAGLAAQYGFIYKSDGLRNDLEVLWNHIEQKNGVALCNLRIGHIVTLVETRSTGENRQVLVIDSNSESSDSRIIESIYECDKSSSIITDIYNQNQTLVAREIHYAVYWASLYIVRDFNLLYSISQ